MLHQGMEACRSRQPLRQPASLGGNVCRNRRFQVKCGWSVVACCHSSCIGLPAWSRSTPSVRPSARWGTRGPIHWTGVRTHANPSNRPDPTTSSPIQDSPFPATLPKGHAPTVITTTTTVTTTSVPQEDSQTDFTHQTHPPPATAAPLLSSLPETEGGFALTSLPQRERDATSTSFPENITKPAATSEQLHQQHNTNESLRQDQTDSNPLVNTTNHLDAFQDTFQVTSPIFGSPGTLGPPATPDTTGLALAPATGAAQNVYNSLLSALKTTTAADKPPAQEAILPVGTAATAAKSAPAQHALVSSSVPVPELPFLFQNHFLALGDVGRIAVWGGLALVAVLVVQKAWMASGGSAERPQEVGLLPPDASASATGEGQIEPAAVLPQPIEHPELEVVLKVPSLEPGWWQTLERIHYINFGSQFGILPRMRFGPRGTQSRLVAFEDAADAEFVAANILESMAGHMGLVPGLSQGREAKKLKYTVVTSTPLFLEDVAAVQGSALEVLPCDCLRHNAVLNPAELENVLKLVLTGELPPSSDASNSQSDLTSSPTNAAAPVDGTTSHSTQPLTPTSRSTSTSTSTPTSRSTSTAATPLRQQPPGQEQVPPASNLRQQQASRAVSPSSSHNTSTTQVSPGSTQHPATTSTHNSASTPSPSCSSPASTANSSGPGLAANASTPHSPANHSTHRPVLTHGFKPTSTANASSPTSPANAPSPTSPANGSSPASSASNSASSQEVDPEQALDEIFQRFKQMSAGAMEGGKPVDPKGGEDPLLDMLIEMQRLTAAEHLAKASSPQGKAALPQTEAESPQSMAAVPQHEAESPQTGTAPPQREAALPQTNAASPQTEASAAATEPGAEESTVAVGTAAPVTAASVSTAMPPAAAEKLPPQPMQVPFAAAPATATPTQATQPAATREDLPSATPPRPTPSTQATPPAATRQDPQSATPIQRTPSLQNPPPATQAAIPLQTTLQPVATGHDAEPATPPHPAQPSASRQATQPAPPQATPTPCPQLQEETLVSHPTPTLPQQQNPEAKPLPQATQSASSPEATIAAASQPPSPPPLRETETLPKTGRENLHSTPPLPQQPPTGARSSPALEVVVPEVQEPMHPSRITIPTARSTVLSESITLAESTTAIPVPEPVDYSAQPWRTPYKQDKEEEVVEAAEQVASTASIDAARGLDPSECEDLKEHGAGTAGSGIVGHDPTATVSVAEGLREEEGESAGGWKWNGSSSVKEQEDLTELGSEVMKLAMEGTPDSLKKAFSLMEGVPIGEDNVLERGELLQSRASLEQILGMSGQSPSPRGPQGVSSLQTGMSGWPTREQPATPQQNELQQEQAAAVRQAGPDSSNGVIATNTSSNTHTLYNGINSGSKAIRDNSSSSSKISFNRGSSSSSQSGSSNGTKHSTSAPPPIADTLTASVSSPPGAPESASSTPSGAVPTATPATTATAATIPAAPVEAPTTPASASTSTPNPTAHAPVATGPAATAPASTTTATTTPATTTPATTTQAATAPATTATAAPPVATSQTATTPATISQAATTSPVATTSPAATPAPVAAAAPVTSPPKARTRQWKSWSAQKRGSSKLDSFVTVEDTGTSSSQHVHRQGESNSIEVEPEGASGQVRETRASERQAQAGTATQAYGGGVNQSITTGGTGSIDTGGNGSANGVVNGGGRAAGSESHREEDADSIVKVVNKGAGSKKKKKAVPKDPREHLVAINRAMALVEEDAKGGETATGEDRVGTRDSWMSALDLPGASNSTPWWREKFEVLYVPYIAHQGGGMGFISVNVSLNPDVRDLRIVTFEDAHDAAHCATVLKSFPEYARLDMSVGQMPTSSVAEDLLAASHAGRSADGLVVFRRGKLLLKVGMTMEDFIQSAVFQAAAQLSLQRTGFDFW